MHRRTPGQGQGWVPAPHRILYTAGPCSWFLVAAGRRWKFSRDCVRRFQLSAVPIPKWDPHFERLLHPEQYPGLTPRCQAYSAFLLKHSNGPHLGASPHSHRHDLWSQLPPWSSSTLPRGSFERTLSIHYPSLTRFYRSKPRYGRFPPETSQSKARPYPSLPLSTYRPQLLEGI